eukprot:12900173-Prorocentrum_lima.AAC.1
MKTTPFFLDHSLSRKPLKAVVVEGRNIRCIIDVANERDSQPNNLGASQLLDHADLLRTLHVEVG